MQEEDKRINCKNEEKRKTNKQTKHTHTHKKIYIKNIHTKECTLTQVFLRHTEKLSFSFQKDEW